MLRCAGREYDRMRELGDAAYILDYQTLVAAPALLVMIGPSATVSSYKNFSFKCLPALIDPWTRVNTLHHVYLTPRTTCALHDVYTSSTHLSMVLSHEITPDPIEPRHCILAFGQVILHMATLHHTTFSPHIRSIITSAFGRTMYQINTSL
jgi:hypothetical protein